MRKNNRQYWRNLKAEAMQNRCSKVSFRFFEPVVGKYYSKGIKGIKILVLNSCLYCDTDTCPHFPYCTSLLLKLSQPYENKCPRHNKALRLEPYYYLEKCPLPLQRIAAYMSTFLGTNDYGQIWSYMAFTTYAQSMYPAANGVCHEMTRSDLCQGDFDAFIEVVQDLRPNIVVVLGEVVSKRLMVQNSYIQSTDELAKTHHYVCHLNIPDMDYPIAVIKCPPSFEIDENDVFDHVFEYDAGHFDFYFRNLLQNAQNDCSY